MTRTTRKAFTLVEMVIVIGVIVLLAALTLSVSVAVVEGSEIRRTENAIQILTTAIQEWEALSDRQVTYGVLDEPPNARYEIPQTDANDLDAAQEATQRLMAIISRPAAVKQILAQLDPELVEQAEVEDGNGNLVPTLVISDAWDTPILAVFPGRTWVQDVNWDDEPAYGLADGDGTIRTPVENECAIAVNRQICFISAGPDGSFGNFTGGDEDLDETEDNIFSYEPGERSVSQP
jgi:prepilin-type N-terminal cleavage/methylation domain-containing protein